MDPASKQAAKYKTQSLLGIINDKMEVGMAKIRGEESAALDVAIIKATLQDEVVPKEKHVRTLKAACAAGAPRQTVNYVIHGLAKRLEENAKAWLVTLKTLIVFHRLLRETDPSFAEELLRYAERTGHHRLLRLESFADHTTKETWDYSAWIRVYSLYLDERLAVFRIMRFDPEQDQGLEARESKLKSCPAAELLEYLPAVQRLLGRLVSCIPEGAAQANEIPLLACSLALKEIRSVYKVVCEGVLNLVDRIFEMDRGDALKGVELVKENLAVNERLNTFMGIIGNIPPLRGQVQFPAVQPLPADFLTTLEDYIKDAPKGAGDAAKSAANRASVTVTRVGTTKLVVGGPIKDPPSGSASPQPAPALAPEVDLLGGFESLSVGGPNAASPSASGAPASQPLAAAPQPAVAFDPFASFVNPAAAAAAPQPETAAAGAAALPPPVATPPPYAYLQASSFANPAAAVAATGPVYGFPGVPAPQPQPVAQPAAPQPASPFGDHGFGAGLSFPAQSTPQPAYPLAQAAPSAETVSVGSAPAVFNPFANPTMHATVAPHMPSPQPAALSSMHASAFAASPAPAAAAAPPPLQVNAFTQLPVGAPASAPQTPAAAQTPPPAMYAGMPGAAAPQQQPVAYVNPFGSPGGPAQPPTNPFGSPGGPSPTQPNPYGMATAAPPAAGLSNPFGGAAGTAAWPGAAAAAPMVVTQQVGGYNLKKPADPLMDLSMDLFGKPQGPPAQQPMRPAQAGTQQNGGGSPGGGLF